MLAECTRRFRDLSEKATWREVGDRFEVAAERLAAINSTKYGELAVAVEPAGGRAKGRPRKADLLAEAASLGLDVPSGATNPQIAALIEEARN